MNREEWVGGLRQEVSITFHFCLPLRVALLLKHKKTLMAVTLWLMLKTVASRVSEMAQRVRVLATKLTTLSSVPGTHMVGGEN